MSHFPYQLDIKSLICLTINVSDRLKQQVKTTPKTISLHIDIHNHLMYLSTCLNHLNQQKIIMARNRPQSAQSRTAWSEDGLDNPGAEMPAAMEDEDYDGTLVIHGSDRQPAVQVDEPKNGCLQKFGRGIRCESFKKYYASKAFKMTSDIQTTQSRSTMNYDCHYII